LAVSIIAWIVLGIIAGFIAADRQQEGHGLLPQSFVRRQIFRLQFA
jgi:uncharacterized membrane protein YeaQ/YmgE (transglycosylase-associated protein family)